MADKKKRGDRVSYNQLIEDFGHRITITSDQQQPSQASIPSSSDEVDEFYDWSWRRSEDMSSTVDSLSSTGDATGDSNKPTEQSRNANVQSRWRHSRMPTFDSAPTGAAGTQNSFKGPKTSTAAPEDTEPAKPQSPSRNPPEDAKPDALTHDRSVRIASRPGGIVEHVRTGSQWQAADAPPNAIKLNASSFQKIIKGRVVISRLFKGRQEWVMITQVDERIAYQFLYYVDGKFPLKVVQERYSKGENIRELSYADNRWILVTEKWKKEYTMPYQSLKTTSKFPTQDISHFWDKGFRVTSLASYQGVWILLCERWEHRSPKQMFSVAKDFPQSQLEKYWKAHKRIQTMGYGNGKWLIISENPTENVFQSYFATNQGFPSEKLRRYYQQNKQIQTVMFAEAEEQLWVVIGETKNLVQHFTVQRTFPIQDIEELS